MKTVGKQKREFMPIDGIDDWAERIERFDATFDYELLDRPAVFMCGIKQANVWPPAVDLCKWDDIDYRLEMIRQRVERTAYWGDALPSMSANIGPDVFPCGFGGELTFVSRTSHITPFVKDLDEVQALHFDHAHHYIDVMDKLYEGMLEIAPGKFYVEMPDFHPNADCLAGFRGPMELCMDCLDVPEKFPAAMRKVTDEYLAAYDWYRRKFYAAGHPCTSWISICSSYNCSIPSCDFSYMVSPQTFDELILPTLTEECSHFERNIFHVDGKGVLNHLDSILDIPSLQMIQWVFGAGGGCASDYIDVYRRCQAKRKSIMIMCHVRELDFLMENLSPRGVFLQLGGVGTEEDAAAILKKVAKWR